MTKSYIYGRVETPKPEKVTQKKSHIPNDVINQDEVEYNQLQNQITQDKIHEAYIKANENLDKRLGMMIERAMRKHKSLQNKELSLEEKDKLRDLSMGKF